MVSRSIHVVVNDNIHSFLWLSNIPLCVCMCTHHIFIHSSIDGHFGCFHCVCVCVCMCVCARAYACVYTPHLYPFIYRWTLWLLPCFSYCKLCCCEHWGACMYPFKLEFSSFLNICYAQVWDCCIIW